MSRTDAYTWLTVEEISQPRSHTCDVIRDAWWSQREDGKVALYRRVFPQCNSSRQIAEMVGEKHFPGYAGTVFIPYAFVSHRCER